jgi:tetratricopeptide (TPR) repeat protein
MLKRTVATIVFAVMGISFPIAAKETSLPKPSQNWIELRTANFRFFSNAGRLATRRVAIDLEELRTVLAELTDYDLQSPIPTYIYVFKSDRSFQPFKTLYKDRPAEITGFFTGGQDANYIAISAAARDASAIVYHEYVHYVSNNNLWYLPLWFSEGLAEFYESFVVDGDTVYIGLPLLRHLAILSGSTPIPLEQLVTVDRSSELYNEADRKGIFYAQSWALVHYLLLGDEGRRQQLDVYLEMVRNGVSGDLAFAEAFSTDYKTMATELRVYLRSLRLPWIESTADVDIDKNFEIRTMSYAEALYRLGDLLASQIPDRPERLTYFKTSAEVDPEYGAPISALAVEAERKAKWETARGLHERASKASPDDPMVLYRWGEFMRRRGGDYRQTAAVLTRSTKLGPSFAPAWAALAKVYADAGDTSEAAIEAARIAYSLRPSDIGAARDLIRLYLRLDRRMEAVSLIEGALRSNRRVQAEAWTLVIQRDLVRAREFLQEGRSTEALRTLATAEKVVGRSLYQDSARQNIEWIRHSVKEHLAADLYDRAQELFFEDDREGARELVEQALEVIDDGPVASACRQLLDIIDHPDRPTAVGVAGFNPSPTPEEIAHLNRLIATNEFESALEFLEDMRGRVDARQQAWFDGRMREIRRVVDYNRYVDEYNRAVDLYNQQQYGEAVEVLDQLLAILPEGRESDSARALLADVLEAMR